MQNWTHGHEAKCRCCGKAVIFFDSKIHTECIPKHWSKHSRGTNASRCKEFGK